MYKFKVLAGDHIELAPPGPDGKVPLTNDGRLKQVKYIPGDIFETATDLLEKHHIDGFPDKFERIHETYVINETPGQRLTRLRAELAEAEKAVPPPSAPSTTVASPVHDLVPELRAMSLKDLQAWAAEEEIDLKGVKSKEEALKVIEAALK